MKPEEFLLKAENDTPKFKSTGEEKDSNNNAEHPKVAGLKLKSLRKHVAMLSPPSSVIDQDSFHNFKELLDEIQEMVDESENSEKGVHQVSEITAAVAGQTDSANPFGEISAPTMAAAAAAATTVGFGSAAAAASSASAAAAAAQPMMVVRKKKKKRDADEGKPPAVEKDDSAKRKKMATE